jgi:hypothetical protein
MGRGNRIKAAKVRAAVRAEQREQRRNVPSRNAPSPPPKRLTPEEVVALTWIPFDGEYEKEFYWALLPDGETVYCWPNAGYMVAVDGSGRQWEPSANIQVSMDLNAVTWS